MLEPLEKRVLFAAPIILFIRGATRSGGFLEATNDAGRTEQLADINNTSTAAGNHGWGTLASTLRSAGFAVEQMTEPKEASAPPTGQTNGMPIHFENLTLSKYACIVFGSNNARYSTTTVDAVTKYIKAGGAAVFISDANFGSNWRDAPDSDQAFLARFGVIVNQDNGKYPLRRWVSGDFAAPNHPILSGVNSFDGEGVSPLVVPATPPAGVTVTRLAAAHSPTRNNNGTNPANRYQGTLRTVTSRDASLVAITAGLGRAVGFFDRNTFFNAGGVGSTIWRLNNRKLALNLFNWVTRRVVTGAVAVTSKPPSPLAVHRVTDDVFSSSAPIV